MNPAAVGDQFPAFKRIGKRLIAISKPVGKGLLVLVIVLGGAYGILACVFTSQYRSEIAAIRARGEPLTPADLMGEEIPDTANAAIVYESIFSELAKEAVLKDLYTLNDFVHRDAAEKDAPTLDEARRALARSQGILDLMEEATSRPKCRSGIDRTDERMPFEGLADFKRLAQLLRASATLEAQDGRMDQAVHSIDMGFKLVKHLEDEPMFIPHLVRIAIFALTSRSIRDALAYGDMSEPQARRLFDTVGEIDAAHGIARAWEGERVYFVRLSHLSDLPAIVGNTSAGGRGGFAAHVLRKALGLFYGPLLRGDQAAYLRFAARQLDGVNLSYREAKSNGLFEEEQNLPFYAIISKIGAGIDARMGMSRYSFEAQAAGAQVFLALQAYKYRHGSYPKTLGELKAKLGWKLPKDPFSGKELVYKRQDKGFLLYSTGPDLKDDGGKELDHYLMPTKPGDIVWKWEP